MIEGKFFHTLIEDSNPPIAERQGWVRSFDDVHQMALVMWFDWITGDDSYSSLVPLQQIMGWRFYDSAEEMRSAYERMCRYAQKPLSNSAVQV